MRTLESYRKHHSSRHPDLNRMKNEDERLLFNDEGLVGRLEEAPAEIWAEGAPSRKRNDQGLRKFLWVVVDTDVPYAEEGGPLSAHVSRGYLSHTNLTGGGAAYCGGELWFRDARQVWVTGGSSRYAPRTAAELDAVVIGFVAAGFAVCSCGWDDETLSPARFFRGGETWRAA